MKFIRDNSEIAAEYREFLRAPHKEERKYGRALMIWRYFSRASQRDRKNYWEKLYNYTCKNGPALNGRDIQRALRKHLARLQGNRCCYCRRWLLNNAYARPIEHVLPKSVFPQFSVRYENLAVSCFDCNELKGIANWSPFKTSVKNYPGPNACSAFFHPRFHKYDAHIRYTRIETNDAALTIYVGRTAQGRHLCSNHLKHIALMEAVCTNNTNLKSSLQKLHGVGGMANIAHMRKFEEFMTSLNQSIRSFAN